MSEIVHHAEGVEEETSTGLSHRKLAIWAFLGSECMFFGSLIATYLVVRGRSAVGPCAGDCVLPAVPGGELIEWEAIFSIPVTSVSTFVLLMSSMSMVLAYSAISRNDIKGFRVWILCTAILGGNVPRVPSVRVPYLLHRGSEPDDEYLRISLLHPDRVPRSARHHRCVVGLLSLFGYSMWGKGLTQAQSLQVDMAALYWHFVDVVWIVIFTVVYLLGVALT